MCIYNEILGNGPILQIQLVTLFSIFVSIVFWLWLYQKQQVNLKAYIIPILFWILFGSLDILITAKGTFGNPYYEANPLSKYIFIQTGYVGPVVASVLWISLWAGIVLVLNKRIVISKNFVNFASLSIFYSLAMGHLFGFSSWFLPFCSVANLLPAIPDLVKIIGFGIMFSLVHIVSQKALGNIG